MRKLVRTVILSVCFFSLFITCKNYSESIDDYLSYWSTAAAIETYTFNPEPHTDAKGTQWVSSTASTTVTFTVRNPKNFELKDPADADAPTDSITFPYDPAISGATAPQANRDYTFKKISNTEFELRYTPAFLQQYEWGSVDITSTIVLHTADGRMFKQTIPFTLKVNTPPPAIAKCVIARTKTNLPTETSYYVLCLQLPAAEMNRELNGSLVHKDIAGITINETSYSLSVNSAQKQFNANAGSPFIGKDSVEKLAADAEEVPSGWTLYFKTNVAVGDPKKSYTISIKDEKGLYSKPVTAATQLSEPQQAQIDVIKGTLIPSLSGDGTEQSKAIVIKADAATPKAQIKLSVPATGGVSATGVTIHYRLTEVGQTPAPEQTKASPITVDMPLNGAGEKMYALTYSTAGVGFKPSASKTVYYKVVKEHTVTFNLAGGNIGGNPNTITMTGIQGMPLTAPRNPSRDGYTFTDWAPALSSPPKFPAADTTYTAQWQEISKPAMRIKEGISAKEKSYKKSGTEDLVPDAELYTNAKPLIIYKESGQAQLSITGSSGTTAYYQIDTGTETAGTEISLSADGNAHKLTVWTKKGSDDSIKTVLYVQVKDALTTYTELKNVVKHASSNTVITIGSDLTCTESSSEIEINKTLTIQCKAASSAPSRYIIDASEKGRIFKVAAGGNLTLENLTLKKGKMGGDITTGIGGGIYIIKGGGCLLKNCSITECKAITGGALMVAGTCTLENSVVEDNSCLANGSAAAAAANITLTGRLVLQGSTVIKNNKKANNALDASAILVAGGITLKGAAKIETGNNIYLSVESAYITVDGTLTASPTAAGVSMPSFAAGRKVLDDDLTSGSNIGKFTLVGQDAEQWKINASGELEAVGGQGSTIDATSWEELRAKVRNAADGTVIEVTKNLTYDISDAAGKDSIIEVNNNITIKSKGSGTCTLNAGGKGADSEQSNDKSTGVFEVSGGKTLTLENLILTKTEKYAVYVAEGDNSLIMKKVTITNCKTKYNAAGIYFNKGKNLTLTDCTIENCKGKGTNSSGGIDIQAPKETVSIKNTKIKNCEVTGTQSTGGGIHLYKGTCTLTNVIIQECKAPKGGGMCVNAGTLTITGGSFTKNEATGTGTNIQGGAIYSEGGSLTLKGCMIGGNTSDEGNTAKKGGGIYLKNVTLTMEGVTVKNNKALTQGGGIYLADGELKIPGGNTIADNSIIDNGNSEAGGGIYVEKGTLTLNGGIISGNSANANKGGGVYLKTGTFTMNSGEIKNCSAKYGGGVSLAGTSTFTMTGGTITGCKADVEGGKGGGIYTELKTKLTLEGAASNPVVISNCTAKETGGGMHIHTQNTVTVKNARIEENSANSGGGVYLEQGTFTIAGSTRITPSTETTAGQNDVFLKEGKFITISGALTAESPIARITPENYTVGAKVLEASSTEYAKFTVTPKDGNTWSIKSDGTLQQP